MDASGPAPVAPKPRAEFGASVWFTVSVGRSGRGRGALAPAQDLRWRRDHQGQHRGDPGAEDQTFVQIALADAGKFGAAMELEPA